MAQILTTTYLQLIFESCKQEGKDFIYIYDSSGDITRTQNVMNLMHSLGLSNIDPEHYRIVYNEPTQSVVEAITIFQGITNCKLILWCLNVDDLIHPDMNANLVIKALNHFIEIEMVDVHLPSFGFSVPVPQIKIKIINIGWYSFTGSGTDMSKILHHFLDQLFYWIRSFFDILSQRITRRDWCNIPFLPFVVVHESSYRRYINSINAFLDKLKRDFTNLAVPLSWNYKTAKQQEQGKFNTLIDFVKWCIENFFVPNYVPPQPQLLQSQQVHLQQASSALNDLIRISDCILVNIISITPKFGEFLQRNVRDLQRRLVQSPPPVIRDWLGSVRFLIGVYHAGSFQQRQRIIQRWRSYAYFPLFHDWQKVLRPYEFVPIDMKQTIHGTYRNTNLIEWGQALNFQLGSLWIPDVEDKSHPQPRFYAAIPPQARRSHDRQAQGGQRGKRQGGHGVRQSEQIKALPGGGQGGPTPIVRAPDDRQSKQIKAQQATTPSVSQANASRQRDGGQGGPTPSVLPTSALGKDPSGSNRPIVFVQNIDGPRQPFQYPFSVWMYHLIHHIITFDTTCTPDRGNNL